MQVPSLIYTVATGEQEGTTILTLIGPLLLYNLFTVQNELRSLVSPVTIVDLEQMPYMDSAGLGLLMNGYVSAANRQHAFLLAGVSERVGALLSLTQVDKVFTIHTSVEVAEAAIRPQGGGGLRPVHKVRVGGQNL